MMPLVTKGIKRRASLTSELVERLTKDIQGGSLRPGDKLPTETEITQEHAVSRTVVREAVSRLQAAGMVETRHGIGTFVVRTTSQPFLDHSAALTARDVLAMLELRCSLDTEAAGLAAARRTDEQLRAMKEAIDRFDADVRAARDAVDADFTFHVEIAKATTNRYFADIMHHLGKATIPRSRVNLKRSPAEQADYLCGVNLEHQRIYDAILRRDPEGARAAMRSHLTNSLDRLRRTAEFEIAARLEETHAL